MEDVHGAIEAVARESYGRLVAYLAARTRDVAAAEDALSEALLAALKTWQRDGVPQKPEAWLLASARRRLIDRARHERVRAASVSSKPSSRSMRPIARPIPDEPPVTSALRTGRI